MSSLGAYASASGGFAPYFEGSGSTSNQSPASGGKGGSTFSGCQLAVPGDGGSGAHVGATGGYGWLGGGGKGGSGVLGAGGEGAGGGGGTNINGGDGSMGGGGGGERGGGGGGGSGGYCESVFDRSSLASSVPITVGAGGIGGSQYGKNGNGGNGFVIIEEY